MTKQTERKNDRERVRNLLERPNSKRLRHSRLQKVYRSWQSLLPLQLIMWILRRLDSCFGQLRFWTVCFRNSLNPILSGTPFTGERKQTKRLSTENRSERILKPTVKKLTTGYWLWVVLVTKGTKTLYHRPSSLPSFHPQWRYFTWHETLTSLGQGNRIEGEYREIGSVIVLCKDVSI